MIRAEEDMTRFQKETGALKIEAQAEAVIEAMAGLKAQIAEKMVQLNVMRTYSTPSNPDLQKIKEALKGLRIELKKLETDKGKGYDPLMPTGRMPEVGTEYVRKFRELKFNETLYELLLKQYEIAKLDEARDAVIFQVIDKAIPPDKRVKPKRTLMVIIAAFVGLFFSVFATFFMEYIEKSSNDPENKERLEMLKRYTALRLKKQA